MQHLNSKCRERDVENETKTDLFPLIESQYRADPGRRVLFGQSIGGQFVLFTALTEPDLFWGRVASNPALHRNLDFFLQRHSSQRIGNARLFVASASDDETRFREPARAWIDHWNAEDDLPWTLRAIPSLSVWALVLLMVLFVTSGLLFKRRFF
jgi:pimeloyl-ACP methyl ester carboxylesterase